MNPANANPLLPGGTREFKTRSAAWVPYVFGGCFGGMGALFAIIGIGSIVMGGGYDLVLFAILGVVFVLIGIGIPVGMYFFGKKHTITCRPGGFTVRTENKRKGTEQNDYRWEEVSSTDYLERRSSSTRRRSGTTYFVHCGNDAWPCFQRRSRDRRPLRTARLVQCHDSAPSLHMGAAGREFRCEAGAVVRRAQCVCPHTPSESCSSRWCFRRASAATDRVMIAPRSPRQRKRYDFVRTRKLRLAIMVAAAVPLTGSICAHDTWLIPEKFHVPVNTAITLDLTSGMEFPKLDVGPKPERVESAHCRLAGQGFPITKKLPAANSLQLTIDLAEQGVATLWVQLPPRALELKPEEVDHYFEEVSPPEELRRQWAEMNPKRWRESYAKHQKTFVRVGEPDSDKSWADAVGSFLEIVPETDPTKVKAGDEFSVRVLRNGVPLAAFSLNAVAAREAKGETRKTDADGRATFRLDKPGAWLLRGTDIRKSDKPETDWESHFATLTLAVQ